MHELSIAMNILDIASEEFARRQWKEVKVIHLTLGPLSGVAKSALLSAFEIAREQTSMARTELVVEAIPLVVFCPACQKQQELPEMIDLCCPVCQTPCADVVSGGELEIVAMEVDE